MSHNHDHKIRRQENEIAYIPVEGPSAVEQTLARVLAQAIIAAVRGEEAVDADLPVIA